MTRGFWETGSHVGWHKDETTEEEEEEAMDRKQTADRSSLIYLTVKRTTCNHNLRICDWIFQNKRLPVGTVFNP